ncbi:hypothetical protein OHT93_38280 [Streptomyces sp. NBC_00191]|uniref:hypothetical protein n=1 Tax=Streptomyces sp. NBC_00191 TaxID=2975674 RepID=UPI0032500CAE
MKRALMPQAAEHGPDRPARPGPSAAQVAGAVAFPAMGSVLTVAGGMPLTDVFALLGGCGVIGAATVAVAGGGRRLAGALVTAAVRAAQEPRP